MYVQTRCDYSRHLVSGSTGSLEGDYLITLECTGLVLVPTVRLTLGWFFLSNPLCVSVVSTESRTSSCVFDQKSLTFLCLRHNPRLFLPSQLFDYLQTVISIVVFLCITTISQVNRIFPRII